MPVVFTEAMDVLPELHVPPEAPSTNTVLPATHTVDEPDIVPADGVVITVMGQVAMAVPHAPATV